MLRPQAVKRIKKLKPHKKTCVKASEDTRLPESESISNDDNTKIGMTIVKGFAEH